MFYGSFFKKQSLKNKNRVMSLKIEEQETPGVGPSMLSQNLFENSRT